MKSKPTHPGKKGPTTMSDGGYGTNYAVFQWNGAEWVVIDNCCDYGCVPLPPGEPGAYVGQLLTTGCSRSATT